MAKRSTPKKQQANGQSTRRYKTYQNKARKRLLGSTAITNCGKCGEAKLAHTVCKACGYYNGRLVIDHSKKMDKITRVKA